MTAPRTSPPPSTTPRAERTVAVLAGGLSHEREVSLRSGRRLAAALRGAGLVVHEWDADSALFERLRAVRLAIARSRGVPPYVIFHDTTLREMARLKPKKPGRNDLCVCGSMRKWKQCCGAQVEA